MGRFVYITKAHYIIQQLRPASVLERHSICLQLWIYWFTVSIWGTPGVNVAVSTTSHTLLYIGVSGHCRMTLMSIWNHMKLKSTEGKTHVGHTVSSLSCNQSPLSHTGTATSCFSFSTSAPPTLARICPEYPALHIQCVLPQSYLEFQLPRNYWLWSSS